MDALEPKPIVAKPVSGGKAGLDGRGFVYAADFRISVYLFQESMKISVDLADWARYLDVAVTKRTVIDLKFTESGFSADAQFL